MQRLEAILFLSREPLTTRKLSQYANLADGTEARTLIRRLNELYDENGRAFRVEQVAGGYQLLTRPQLAGWVRRLAHVPAETRLSPPALETLSVVAYRQPVLKADIEAIRGVSCGEVLRQLMERDLVRIGGRSEELGRPYLYATTKHFLQTFGLKDLGSLPQVEALHEEPVEIQNEKASEGNVGNEDTRNTGTGNEDTKETENMSVVTTTEVLPQEGEELQPQVGPDEVASPQAVSTFEGEDDDDDWGSGYSDDDNDWDDDDDDDNDDDDDDDDDFDEDFSSGDEWQEVEDDDDDDDGDDWDDGDDEDWSDSDDNDDDDDDWD